MEKEGNTSVDKILKILLSFAPYNQEQGTVEISQKLGFHTATVSRNLQILTAHGFLNKNPKSKKYRLGQSILTLWDALRHSLDSELIQVAIPFLDELRDAVQETVVLEILSGDTTVIVYMAEANSPLRIKGTIGDRRPLHAPAGAKAILAFSSREFIDQILSHKLARLTPNTLTDPKIIEDRLRKIKQQGFSFDNEETNIGINAYGAPVFNYENKPIAAVVVAGPTSRIKAQKHQTITSKLKKTAEGISSLLLHRENRTAEKRNFGKNIKKLSN
jgi:DNA-binding IclR family transcriptional regulator